MGPRHFSRGISTANKELRPDQQSFNGAAAFQPRNCSGIVGWYPDVHASMGPRHFSRRIWAMGQLDRKHQDASMGPRHFSRGIITHNRMAKKPDTSFNGAAAFQPRNCSQSRARGCRRSHASMGPRHFSRGILWDAKYRRRSYGFNGAAAFQPRN